MRDRKGCTIAEPCIAMSIVGILAVISCSNLFAWFDHAAVVDSKRELFAMSNEARTRGMASNRQHLVVIDITNNMALQRGDKLTGATSWSGVGNVMDGARGEGIKEIVFDNGTTLSATTVAFMFNRGGQVLSLDNPSNISPMDQAKIRLTADNPTDRATIRIYGFPSKARIEDGWN